jgi:NAD(P)-dependent dehydrogenase (short-subunit alcohol dehydrogenase family)
MKKTVVVTGASSGLGYAIAEAFLGLGYNVIGNARTASRLAEAASRLGHPDNFLAVEGDIAERGTAERIFEKGIARFGQIDVLVNNAGIFIVKPFAEYTNDEIDALIDTNLRGFVYPSQLAARHMSERGEGHIINITASLAMQPSAHLPAALPLLIKGGLNNATKALAIELASRNVKVSAVAPGIIDTPMHSPETHGFLNGLSPMGRIGTAKDVADAVVYLAQAEYATGVILPIDGGSSAGTW